MTLEHYSKIDTLFKRNDKFKLREGDWTRPEFAYINYWSVTEKVDGTSTFIHFEKGDGYDIGGRTDRADLPGAVQELLAEVGYNINPEAESIMDHFGLDSLTVYGESYGPKINGGGAYGDEVRFAAFDIKVDGLWLSPEQFAYSADMLGVEVAPLINNVMSTQNIVDFAKHGFASRIPGADKRSEGVIAKSLVTLHNNAGKRLMFKLKTNDFTH